MFFICFWHFRHSLQIHMNKKKEFTGMMNRYVVNPYVKYSYRQMTQDAETLEKRYPDLIRLSSIGTSIENRELLLIRLGTGGKKLLLLGAHHGREYITSAYLMCITEHYSDKSISNPKLYEDFDIAETLKNVTFYIVPMVNPDGVTLSIRGKSYANKNIARMRMIHSGYEKWKANINGVDLNLNYPCKWETKLGPVNTPASELFKGYTAASEPEVRAVMELCSKTHFRAAATFHSTGEKIYWADENTSYLVKYTRPLALKLAEHTGYALAPVSLNGEHFAAGFENWFRAQYARPCFLFEIAPDTYGYLPPNMHDFDRLVWGKMQTAGLKLASLFV